MLLSTIVPREPLDAAGRGVRSANPGVRGLAIEYLDQVLPPAVLERLNALMASTPGWLGNRILRDAGVGDDEALFNRF